MRCSLPVFWKWIKRENMVYLVISLVIAISDLLIKNKIYSMEPEVFPIEKAGGKIHIERCFNYGLAGSRLKDNPHRVKVITTVAAVFMAIFATFNIFSGRRSIIKKTGVSMMLGGTLSNLSDRYTRGFVVDYLNFTNPVSKKKSKYVYNISDFCIIIGCFLVFAGKIFRRHK